MSLRNRIASVVILAAVGLVAGAHAGPLSPPAGPVAPTYKTLTEVEPRIAINAINTPGDATSIYRITHTGSYYLTGMVVGAPGKHGILIAANGVTIDLNGYDLVGNVGSFSGIRAAFAGLTDISIVNGSVRAWGSRGVDLDTLEPRGSRLHAVRATGNGSVGIMVHSGVIDACTSSLNTREGFMLGSGTISNCEASGNELSGIDIGAGSTAVGCSATHNRATGIVASSSGVIADCAAAYNDLHGISAHTGSTVRGCSSANNDGHGILVYGSSVIGCTTSSNGIHGIIGLSRCLILNNTSFSNGDIFTSDGAGIRVGDRGTRIEGNNCGTNPIGIHVDSYGNVITRNTCSDNATDWNIVANNIFGPIIDRRFPASPAVLGFGAPGTLGSTDPNANFSY